MEYRRAGTDGARGAGGWPATFEDIASGIEALANIAQGHNVEHIKSVLVGHSAGGHLAVWAAGRGTLPKNAPGAGPRVTPLGVVSQAGVLNLAAARELHLSSDGVENLMGTALDGADNRYKIADPMLHGPINVPIYAVHSRDDESVPFAISKSYVDAAVAAGASAKLYETSGDHFAVITPGTPAYELCVRLIGEILRT